MLRGCWEGVSDFVVARKREVCRCEFGLLGGHGCGCEGKVVSVDMMEECAVYLINWPGLVELGPVADEDGLVYGNI